ncbi:MAG: hypothetical protein GY813_02165, partial [Halieaceae bacterium]|nr:hypothetical protein [Halieaceae bacterium]
MPLDFSAFDEKEPQGLDFSAIDKEEPNKGLDFSAIDADKPGLNPAREAPEQPGMFSNIARGIGERAGELAGNLASIGSRVADVGEEALPLGGITWGKDGLDFASGEEWEQHRQDKQFKEVRPLESAGQAMKDLDLGYKPRNTWEEVKESYNKGDVLGTIGDAVAFGFEVGAVSLPDMAAAITTLPAYVTSRTEELATERANNQGREEANAEDYAIGAPTAITVSILERFGAQQLLKMSKGGSIVGGLVKGAAYEGLTETQQEMVEYLGANAGTKEGATFNGAIERGLQGLIGGGTFGGVAGGVSAAAGKMAGTDESADPSTPETTPQDPLPDEHELEVEAAEQGPKPYEVGGILGNINPNAGLADPAPTMDGPPTPTQEQVAQRPESIEYDYAGAPVNQEPTTSLGASTGQPQYDGGIDFDGPQALPAGLETAQQTEARINPQDATLALPAPINMGHAPIPAGAPEATTTDIPAATKEEVAAADAELKRSKLAKDRAKRDKKVKPDDSLKTAISKMGGVNTDEMIADGFDESQFKGMRHKLNLMVNKGKLSDSVDGMLERLNGNGWQFKDRNELLTAMMDEFSNKPHYTAEGHGIQAEQAAADAQLDKADMDAQNVADDAARAQMSDDDFQERFGFPKAYEDYAKAVQSDQRTFDDTEYESHWHQSAGNMLEAAEVLEAIQPGQADAIIEEEISKGLSNEQITTNLLKRAYAAEQAAKGAERSPSQVQKEQGGGKGTEKAPVSLPSPDAGLSDPGTKSPEGKLPITQTPPSNKASSPQDLLGDDTRTEQAAADLSREKDEKRSPGGAQPAEAQSGDD